MLAPEEENENEVRRVDQANINKFSALNRRLHDVEFEMEAQKKVSKAVSLVSIIIRERTHTHTQSVWTNIILTYVLLATRKSRRRL